MKNIYPVKSLINTNERKIKYKHSAHVFWFYGLSGSGKSTIALEVEKTLFERGYHVVHIDGDCLRATVNKDLSFSEADRAENIRRATEISKILFQQGVVVLASFITPLKSYREIITNELGENVSLLYISANLETCQQRDPKGIYKASEKGNVSMMTGVSSPFEAPKESEKSITIVTENAPLKDSVDRVLSYIYEKIQ